MKRSIFIILLICLFVLGIFLIAISVKPVVNNIHLPLPKLVPLSIPNPSIAPSLIPAQVERVIDGDTIELTDKSRVRMIGINTPEIVDPQKPVECFGLEAKNKTQGLLSEKNVLLEQDKTNVDKYGRLLRYVYVIDPNNVNQPMMVNEILVKQGFAFADPYPPDIKYEQQLNDAQQQARLSRLGLWGNCK